MKIAIVAPSPTPFTIGGAEKLWMGIYEYINKHTTHQCELIKIAIKENSFWDLIDAYYKFYTLDLSHFDMVITGKYPAWMVNHKNHHIYMLHTLRGFYDCSHFLNIDENIKTNNKLILEILNKIQSDVSIKEIFELIYKLKDSSNIDKNIFSFPGAFIKKLVHFFDKQAMKNIKNFSAISKTVANRKEYFPLNTSVKVIYPPSSLENFYSKNYEYFFVISRLDSAKRIDLILKAYLKSNSKIPLKIAGTGPLEKTLKELAKNDQRVEFLGYVSDSNLINYYANAYAVIFTPYEEDYGLVTIEAMMSKKAVITFSDSGGVLEFVKHNITGLVSNPNIDELAQNIEKLANNLYLCKKMGQEAKKAVENITWHNLIENLLNIKRKKITVVTTYPIYPPRGGGQNRIFYLYKEIAKYIEVDIICLTNENEKYQKKEIANNLYEIRVPKTKQHAQKEWQIEQKAGIPITDIAMLYLSEDTPLLIETIKNSAKESAYIVSSQFYIFNLIKKHVNIPIIHESQNVEYILKKQMLKDNSHNKKLLKDIFNAEQNALNNAYLTTVCAKEDALTYEKLYNSNMSKAVVVPNGVDLDSVSFVNKQERLKIKKSLNLENAKIAIFIGSWHQPNIEAAEEIFKIANKLPNYKFIIIGSVKGYFESKKITTPTNVGFAGIVTNKEKELYLKIADIALNPMMSGSGTNLKMLDYMASGITVVSTSIGARGLNIPKGYIAECNIKDFAHYIKNIERYVDIEKSRNYTKDNFSWRVIAKNYKKYLV